MASRLTIFHHWYVGNHGLFHQYTIFWIPTACHPLRSFQSSSHRSQTYNYINLILHQELLRSFLSAKHSRLRFTNTFEVRGRSARHIGRMPAYSNTCASFAPRRNTTQSRRTYQPILSFFFYDSYFLPNRFRSYRSGYPPGPLPNTIG